MKVKDIAAKDGGMVTVAAIQKDFGGCAKNIVESILVKDEG